jgi:hypothetical protein
MGRFSAQYHTEVPSVKDLVCDVLLPGRTDGEHRSARGHCFDTRSSWWFAKQIQLTLSNAVRFRRRISDREDYLGLRLTCTLSVSEKGDG